MISTESPFPVLTAASGAGPAAQPKTLKQQELERYSKAARDFESVFVSMMLKSMRTTVGKNKILSAGHGGEVFQDLQDLQFSQATAHQGRGIGIADMLIRQYSKKLDHRVMENTKLSSGRIA